MKTPPKKLFEKPPRRRKFRLRRVNLDRLHRQLLNVLRRDVEKLLEISLKPPLPSDARDKLLLYFKQVKTLRKDELDELEGLSDEELAKLSKEEEK